MNRYVTLFLISVLFLSIFASSLFCAKYAANFLDLGAGARAIGMGGAFTALSNDVTAVWWNPAGLSKLKKTQCNFMHSVLYDYKYQYDTGALSIPFENFALGVDFILLQTSDIPFTKEDAFYDWGEDNLPGTDDPGEGNGTHDLGEMIISDFEYKNEYNYALNFSVSKSLTQELSVGLSSKLLRQNIGQYVSTGFGLDASVLYNLNENINLGIQTKDLTSTFINWDIEGTSVWEKKLPSLQAGIYYKRRLLPWVKANICTDLYYSLDQIFSSHVGTEIWLKDIFAIRAGYNNSYFTAGAGIKLSFFNINYAFIAHDISDNHRLAVTMELPFLDFDEKEVSHKSQQGSTKEEQKGVKLPEVKPKETTPTTDSTIRSKKKPSHKKPKKKATEEKPPDTGKIVATILFEKGKATLKPEYYDTLRGIAQTLSEYSNLKLKIEGHTDNLPISTEKYSSNYELSVARANRVKKIILRKHKINEERLITKGWGEKKPKFPNTSPSRRAKNRRVEIYFIKK